MWVLVCGLLWFVTQTVFGETVKELGLQEVLEYTVESHWTKPGCILFHNNDSSIIHRFDQYILKSRKQKSIAFYTHYSKHGNLVQCFNGNVTPFVFQFDGKQKFLPWLKQVFNTDHTGKVMIQTDINSLQVPSKTLLVLWLPWEMYLKESLEMMAKVDSLEISTNISTYFVAPNTKQERLMVEQMNVEHFPSVFIFHRQSRHHKFELFKKLEGNYEVNEESIKLSILQFEMRKESLNPDTLIRHVTNKYELDTPNCIAVYSSSNPKKSYPYLHAYYRAYSTLKSSRSLSARLFILNLSEAQNSIALPKHLKSTNILSVPFTFCVYRNYTAEMDKVEERLLPSNTIPTPYALEMFLQHLLPVDKESQYRHVLFEQVCHVNSTDYCLNGDEEMSKENEEDERLPFVSKPKNVERRLRKRKRGLQPISDSTWSSKIFGYNKQESWFHETIDFHVKHDLVVFISAGCSYCKLANTQFQEVAKLSSFLDDTSVYVMNCSHSPIKCKEYHVTGYPTLLLFRTIQSDNCEKCMSSSLLVEPSWVDYHGSIEVSSIMDWLNDVINPSLKIVEKDDLAMSKDVKLLIKFYTKDYVMRYLPRSFRGTLLHLSCLSMLCELLHSRLECVGTPYEGVTYVSSRDTDLFVASVEFIRADETRALLMKAGKPMDQLLQMEDMKSRNSKFHQPHNYNMPLSFVCEDNHVKCVDIIRQFVLDHSRLPILKLSEEMFHTHRRSNNELWKQPILLALAHTQDLNVSTSFYKGLYKLAVQFYQRINVAVLDIDKHFHWSKMFVPRDHYDKIKKVSKEDQLKQYPRFCIIQMDDHTHAAFYPRLVYGDDDGGEEKSTDINFNDLSQFMSEYLVDPSPLLVETEHF